MIVLDTLAEWFNAFIDAYRDTYANANASIQSQFKYFDNFTSPCQVLAIWLTEPDIEQVYVTRDPDRPDKEIICFGPIRRWEALDVFERVLSIEWLRKPLSPSDDDPYMFFKRYGNYGRFLEDEFIAIMKALPYWTMIPPRHDDQRSPGFSKMPGPVSGFKWMVIGNLLSYTPQTISDGIFNQAETQAQYKHRSSASTGENASRANQERVNGFTTFFYPPVWVGKIPRLTFRQKVQGLVAFPPEQFSSSYKGRQLILDQRGRIFIGEPDKEKCKRYFNEIMATVSILLFQVQPVNENDMGETTLIGSGSQMAFPQSSERYSMAEISIGPTINEQTLGLFRESSENTILSLIERAEHITKNEEAGDLIIFLLFASNHFSNTEYIESFTMAWVIVEKYLNSLWRRTLLSQGLPRSRVNKLADRLSIDYVIECLDAFKQISRTDFEKYMKLKNIRNEISHQGYQVLKSEAENCLNAAEDIVKKLHFT